MSNLHTEIINLINLFVTAFITATVLKYIMKKILVLVFAACLAVPALKAQTVEETLEWMNAKKDEVLYVYSNTVSHSGKIKLTSDQIEAYKDDGAYSRYTWSKIKDAKIESMIVKIIFDDTYDGAPAYIKLFMNSSEIAEKFVKAIRNMATLKGAKLVKDDLF
jgi:uncharacterized protein YxeA